MNDAFDAAMRTQSGLISTHHFRMGAGIVRLRCIGTALANRIAKPFCHLKIDAAEKQPFDLTIDLWDETVSRVRRPFADLRDLLPHSDRFADGIIATDSLGIRALQTPRAATILSISDQRIVGWVKAADNLSYFESGKPLQPLLFAWHEHCGVLPLHAALVAQGERGLLLGGPGGSGKSTTAIACVREGLKFLGDDYVGLAPDDSTAYSFYSTAWLTTKDIGCSWTAPYKLLAQYGAEEKRPVCIADAAPDLLLDRVAINALILPRITGLGRAQILPAGPAEALRHLAASSVLQLPLSAPILALTRIGNLIRKVPAFWLNLGSDMSSVPDLLVREIIGGASAK